MKSRRRRNEIRQKIRQAQGKASPPTAYEKLTCRCGHAFKLAADDEGKTFLCPGCRKKFRTTRVAGPAGTAPRLEIFPADEPQAEFKLPSASRSKSTETHAPTSVVEALRGNKMPKGVLDDAIEPEPPPQIEFACPCGEKLVATRKTYDRRATCSRCGVHLLVSVVFDVADSTFSIIPLRVGEPAP